MLRKVSDEERGIKMKGFKYNCQCDFCHMSWDMTPNIVQNEYCPYCGRKQIKYCSECGHIIN